MARFITLAGRKQVGKDTSAQYIKHLLEANGTDPNRVHIVHFADALKRACVEIFGLEESDLETEVGKQKLTDVVWPVPAYDTEATNGADVMGYYPALGESKPMTVREVLQFVGTELFRNQMDPNIWVKSVYRKKWRDDDVVIVADCRFPNEGTFARDQGVLINVQRETGLATDNHASETALDDFDGYHYTIVNNGSFDQLRQELLQILVTEGFLVTA